MPEAIVDQVETIEVQDHHRAHVLAVAVAASQRLINQVEQQKLVRQAGERIVKRSVARLPLVLFP